MTSVSGQAADVSVMSMSATLPCSPFSTFRSYTRPRSTTLIPSSGSTTSRMASSRSPSSSSLGTAVSLIARLLTGLRHCVFEGHPAQQRTFDPRRVLGHPREGDAVAEYILVALNLAAGRNHLVECRDGLQRIADAPADDQVREHRRRSLADRATLPVVGDVGHRVAVVGQRDAQRHLVPACRIHLERLRVIRLPQPAAVRVFVVIEDHFLIDLLQPHCQSLPKNSTACRTPATRRSTSSSVLYTANDARAVAAMPNRRCSGHAQW